MATTAVKIAFHPEVVTLALAVLQPLKQVKLGIKAQHKYQQVLASVREVGLIEPLIVFPQDGKPGTYLLLDGHIRVEVLKQLGQIAARCIVATDDEAYTYNKMINHIATVQEHFMILRAINSGVSEERIAKVLDVNIATIRLKRDLLHGICPEVVELLRNKHIAYNAFRIMKKLRPVRQLEVAELLIAANNYTAVYAKALFAATRPELLVDTVKVKTVNGLSLEQMARMEKEMDGLQRDLKVIEASHGNDVLNLVLAGGYLQKLFANGKVIRYLSQRHQDIIDQLHKIVDNTSMDNQSNP